MPEIQVGGIDDKAKVQAMVAEVFGIKAEHIETFAISVSFKKTDEEPDGSTLGVCSSDPHALCSANIMADHLMHFLPTVRREGYNQGRAELN